MAEEDSTLDFDQFWADHITKPGNETEQKVKILGEYYNLTVDVPFALLIQTMTTDSNDIQGMSEVIDRLYGEGTLAVWLSKGLSLKQLPIIAAWSIARIQGRDLSFEEVADQLKDFLGAGGLAPSNGTGPQLNRASRRAMAKDLKKSGK
jgi:hypothetical protein